MKTMRGLRKFYRWLFEGESNEGWGGAPNNGQFSPEFPTRGHGMGSGHLWYSMHFDNDAHDLWICTQYSDDSQSQHMCVIPAEDFRKLALWYLWRWAWGEWFGLRRWLFYRALDRTAKSMGWR